jgi:hypothetical protein
MRQLRWIVVSVLLFGGCFQDSTPQHSTYLPLDYQTTFPTVRDCRLVVGHQNSYEKVFANPIAHDAYLAPSYPLPEGSVVVAEQHGDPSCSSLSGYLLMAKQSAGYDSSAGDWRWQRLDVNQRVDQDGKLTSCSSCHAKCLPADYVCSPR